MYFVVQDRRLETLRKREGTYTLYRCRLPWCTKLGHKSDTTTLPPPLCLVSHCQQRTPPSYSLNYSWYALALLFATAHSNKPNQNTGARVPHHCFPDQTRSLVLMFTSTTRAEPPSQNRLPPRVSPKHTPPAPSPFFVFSAFFFTCLRQTLFFLYVWGTHFHTTCFGKTTHPNTPTTQATKPARRQLGQACEIIFTFPPPSSLHSANDAMISIITPNTLPHLHSTLSFQGNALLL